MLRAVVPNDGTITVRYAPIKDCEEFIIFKELVELADQNDFRVGSSCWKVSDQKYFIQFNQIKSTPSKVFSNTFYTIREKVHFVCDRFNIRKN